MSLLMKRREQEKLRQNGLNDRVQRTVKRQEGFDSWPAAMQQPMYPGNMQAPAKPMRGQITEDFMRDIMQQGYNVPPPMKKKQADRNIPGWSISANGPDNYPTDIPQNFSPDLPESFTSEAQPNYTGNALQNYASNIPQNFTASIEPKFSSNAPQISFQTPADPALMETGVLPEDYYDSAPVYIDPSTGKEITFDTRNQLPESEMGQHPSQMNMGGSQQMQYASPPQYSSN